MDDTKEDGKRKKLFPFGDYDKDGVPNLKDCDPFDPNRHGGISYESRCVSKRIYGVRTRGTSKGGK